MKPGSATDGEASPEGVQVFGKFFVRINSKKHKTGDRVIIRIERGIAAKDAELLVKSILRTDSNDPSEEALEVARYLRSKLTDR
jgi:hypothetical protein